MASLKDVGQTQMGKTGTVSLSEIGTKGASQGGTDGYTRTFVTTANDYKRVNPFEVAALDAPDPIGIPTPYSLLDWEGYQQWSAGATPTNVKLTQLDRGGSGTTNGRITVEYTIPGGFTDFDAEVDSDIHVGIYIKSCTDQGDGSPCGEPTFEDPFTGTQRISDASSYQEASLLDSNWYILAVRVEWDDESGNAESAFPRLSNNGEVVAASSTSASSDTGDDIIYFKTPDFVCTSQTAYPSSETGNCSTSECESITGTGNVCASDTIPRAIWEVCCRKDKTSPFNAISSITDYEDGDGCVHTTSTCATLVTYNYWANTDAWSGRDYFQLTSGCEVSSGICASFFDNTCGGTNTEADICSPSGGGDGDGL